VCRYYLFPAMEAAAKASDPEKRTLKAWSALILALLLFVLVVGLLLSLRIGRFFFPRPVPRGRRRAY